MAQTDQEVQLKLLKERNEHLLEKYNNVVQERDELKGNLSSAEHENSRLLMIIENLSQALCNRK